MGAAFQLDHEDEDKHTDPSSSRFGLEK